MYIFEHNPGVQKCRILAVSTFIAQESPTSYLINSISPMLQVLTRIAKLTIKNLSKVRDACDSTEAVISLTITTVDSHLLSNLPTINAGMIKIPFTKM